MLLNTSLWKIKYKSGIICGNINIRNIFYYGETRNLPDKLIKRQIYIKAINFMPHTFPLLFLMAGRSHRRPKILAAQTSANLPLVR